MIKNTLQDSIFEVFEKMFFVFLERSERRNLEYRWVASISFSGDKQGELNAYFNEDIADLMVKNMLNIPENEITEKLREDCMKESVNMICGDFLRNFDSSKVFDLSLPVIGNGPGGIMVNESDEEDKTAFSFGSGSGLLGVVLMFR